MYTLFLKYTIDPNKLSAWKEYAQAEFAPITESGGRITGYYAPTEFADATSEAFATIDVGTMAEYVRYALQFAFGSSEIPAPIVPGYRWTHQIEPIHHRFKRIVDFMRDCCCHSPSRCKFLRLQDGLFQAFGNGNVSQNLRGTNDLALSISDW
jgi:hypothetical protein